MKQNLATIIPHIIYFPRVPAQTALLFIGLFAAKETKIMINPRGVKIVANTVGFFIANDAEEVRRANAFCKVNCITTHIHKCQHCQSANESE